MNENYGALFVVKIMSQVKNIPETVLLFRSAKYNFSNVKLACYGFCEIQT